MHNTLYLDWLQFRHHLFLHYFLNIYKWWIIHILVFDLHGYVLLLIFIYDLISMVYTAFINDV
jgi:hypothetical protein